MVEKKVSENVVATGKKTKLSLNEKLKKDFAVRTNKIIEKGLLLLEKRFSTALEKEEELSRLIEELSFEKDTPSKSDISALLKQLQMIKSSEVISAVATLYDKRTATGDSADKDSMGVMFELSHELQDYAK